MEEQLSQIVAQLQTLTAQNAELMSRSNAAETAFAELKAKNAAMETRLSSYEAGGGAAASSGGFDGGGSAIQVAKWAPDSFDGTAEAWPVFKTKFVAFVGPMLRGQMGEWLDHVDLHRADPATARVLGSNAKTAAGQLHHYLIATCNGKALTLVERAGRGEGLESWRLLLQRFEPRTRQSRVVKHIQLLNWDFTTGDFVDNLEQFDKEVAKYEKEAERVMDEEEKIGLIIRGMQKGSLQEHLLLYSERCSSYAEFRQEIDTIARAQQAKLLQTQPMDISAFGGKAGKQGAKGGGKHGKAGTSNPPKFEGECRKCGKKGHMAKDCWSKGQSKGGSNQKADAGKRACFECGSTSHLAKDCRAPKEKRDAYKAKQRKGKNVHELDQAQGGSVEELNADLGQFMLCELCGTNRQPRRQNQRLAADRADSTRRHITFGVDSAACVTVVPSEHEAARGYKVWQDSGFGRNYSCANNAKVPDEGLRVLSVKTGGGQKPVLIRTRKAKVKRPLLAVADFVDSGKSVVFDSEGSYAICKATGQKTRFERKGRGWDLSFDLQSPEEANTMLAELRAQRRQEEAVAKEKMALQVAIRPASAAPVADYDCCPFSRQGHNRL